MAFVGSMLSNSNGSGYDATAQQGSTNQTGQQALQNGGVAAAAPASGASNPFGGGVLGNAFAQGSAGMSSGASIGDQSASAAAALGGVNQNLANQAQNGSTLAANQLAQATGQNIQNATGMISSQKGLNPALAARQATETAGAANQQAGNQSAQLQAQTQMAANQALSGNLLGQQQIYQGAIANQNNNQTQIAQGNQKAQQGVVGGVLNGVGGLIGLAKGGRVGMADGGAVDPGAGLIDLPQLPANAPQAVPPTQTSGPLSAAGKFFKGFAASMGTPKGGNSMGSDPIASGVSSLLNGIGSRIRGPQAPALPANAPQAIPTDAEQAAISPVAAPNAVVQPGALPQAPAEVPAMADGGDVQSEIEAGGGSAPAPKDDDKSKDPLSTGTSSLISGIMGAMAKGGKVEDKKAKLHKIIEAHMKKHGVPTDKGAALNPTAQSGGPNASSMSTSSQALAPQSAMLASGGKVPVMLSPGERYLSPAAAKAAKEGKVDPMKAGQKVPGKAKVEGAKNDYANDTVPASLEKGGLVLPRSVTQAKDPGEAARKFVTAHMAKGGKVLAGKKKAK